MATMPVQLAHLPHLIFHLQVPVSVRSCVGGRGYVGEGGSGGGYTGVVWEGKTVGVFECL